MLAGVVGLLLSLVFFEFFEEIIENVPASQVGLSLFIGVLLFHLFETVLHFHHCHDICDDDHGHSHDHLPKQSAQLLFAGTFLHNFFHGVILYIAFLSSVESGVALSLAIFLHSVPQNFAHALLWKDEKLYPYLAVFGGVFGVMTLFFFEGFIVKNAFFILGIMSGGILYLSLSDLLPTFQNEKKKIPLFFSLFSGVIFWYILDIFL